MANSEIPRLADDGTARIRPRARIMRTLGDELISSEVVAIIELVKNAYDADATRVLVRFHEPLECGQGGIDVIDNGHGMTLETVLDVFLEPATSFRSEHRRSEEFKRVVTGEKGIGRFAVSRLADELELVSRRPGAPDETHVLFDWSAFDDPNAYLDEIDVAWESTPPRDITEAGVGGELWGEPGGRPSNRMDRGTCLRMTRLRSHWGGTELAALRTGLSRLISPFLFEQTRGGASFSILLQAPPAFPNLSGPVEPPEALERPHYALRGRVDADGNYDVTLSIRDRPEAIVRRARVPLDDRRPATGPFEVELRVWDRDRPSLDEVGASYGATYGQVREDLDNAAGVNIYRDGFRVLPYGEPDNDWLRLDARRVQNPTMRLSNNQIVGYVLVSSDENPQLRDQTNREGLLRNAAFEDLVGSLRVLLGELEQARFAVRHQAQGSPRQPRAGGLFSTFDLAPVRDYVGTRYPLDAALADLVTSAQRAIEQDVAQAQEVLARYRRLATLGQLIDKVLHDGRAPLAKIGNEAVLGLREISRRDRQCQELVDRLAGRLQDVQGQHDVLATVFRRIEPFGGRKRGRPTQVVLEEAIADGFGVLASDIEHLGVGVSLPTTRTLVTVDRAELQEIIVNLLDNSLHWLSQAAANQRKIEVRVDRDAEGVHILFSDSGPGVRADARDHIFEPYYSTKPDGIGLGLNIAGEIVDEYYGGELQLLDSGPLPGASFRVTLRRRV